MDQQPKPAPNPSVIEEYRRQLMALHRQQSPAPAAQPPTQAAPPPEQDEAWLEEQFPLPDLERDRAAMPLPPGQPPMEQPPEVPPRPEGTLPPYRPPQGDPQPTPPRPPQDDPPPAEPDSPSTPPESPFVGYLRVFVFTGGGAEPLPEARVTVARSRDEGETIYANLQTNRDGLTPVIPLPSVDPALTLRPGTGQPYTAYNIRVSLEGFSTAEYTNVPVYGNNYVTQPVPLYPLLPGEDPDTVRRYQSGGPTNL